MSKSSTVETQRDCLKLIFSIFALLSSYKLQASSTCLTDQKIKIGPIHISGNLKTKSSVILRELKLLPHQTVCEDQISSGISRVKRTGLFSQVNPQLIEADASDIKTLSVEVVERWTTLPVLKASSGGGVSQFTLGIYDPNINGEFIEAGTQYENLAGASSGILWFKNPRLFGQDHGIDLQYWNIKRIRVKYDQNSSSPLIKSGFLQEREKIYADYFREISTDHVIRFSLDYNGDHFSTDFLPDDVLEKNGPNPILPTRTQLIISKVGFEIGQVQGEPQSLEGSKVGFYFGYAQPLNSKVDPFVQGDINYNSYFALAPGWQFAQRFLVGSTSTEILQYWHYLGGLDRIRGFADNRFSGRHFGLSNSEVRYLFFQHPSLLVQAAGFLDLTSIGDKFADLNQIHAASFGGGFRFILPKFYRFVLRLDYAKPIIKNDTMNFSLGVQQFF